MKIQCPSCKEIVEMSDFSTSSEGLRFSCPACGREHFLPNPRRDAAEADVFNRATREYPSLPALAAARDEEGVVCPKCGNFQKDTYACHRCGLVFEKFDPAILPPDPQEAAAIWQQIENQPFQTELHERFLQTVHAARRLDYAARQYRLLERRPGLEELARTYQQRLAALAQSLLPAEMLRQQEEKPSSHKSLWLILAILLLTGLIGWSLYYYLQG